MSQVLDRKIFEQGDTETGLLSKLQSKKLNCLQISKERPLILKPNDTSFECNTVMGNGTFGIVYRANEIGKDGKYDGQTVAIKRVLQDRRFKNRELQIMKMLHHPNVITLINSFFEHEKNEVFLNLVMDYMPITLHKYLRQLTKARLSMPLLQIQLYVFQLCRALGYIHSIGICHRDIKPQNLLIDPQTHQLKICDFGSAKVLVQGKTNVSYVCSRYYRAPELIFGAIEYTQSIDVWSAGCVFSELLLGRPLFSGESGLDQLVEIIKILGTPNREQILSMNPNYTEFTFPYIEKQPWSKVLPSGTPESCLELISRMIVYTPAERITPLDSCSHRFFDNLHHKDAGLSLIHI
eukprot:TRINITY_DN2501_c0_g1_i1.p1 TRINITY_DN2501_c0_g1~~TRINITY_DN2501_c0_g1_i1.p1  ORF type:complete len:367 (+),score=41.62 TRINITY_DN2501_c0_g1_i1:49-1101(+)